jgi:acyl carrier protein
MDPRDMDPRHAVREFIKKLLADKGDTAPFADTDSLLLAGRLQSLDAVEIVVFLEEKFSLDFADLGFDQEKIDSVEHIVSLLQTVRTP